MGLASVLTMASEQEKLIENLLFLDVLNVRTFF